jgi:energy-coupling factor transporter ATP-binding protein EcfA2/GNAT superfamily N-acetyltransferase
MFDLPDQKTIEHRYEVDLPIEDKPWTIGLIVGPSGSGKTSIARHLFADAVHHEAYTWPDEQAIVDGFDSSLTIKEIIESLSSVGFSSPPHWIKRYSHLSNGQKFRVELARLASAQHDLIVFDEFSSVVDRDAARVSSAAFAKRLRTKATQGSPTRFVAVCCHYDVIEWLDPDWILDTNNYKFACRSLRKRPAIELSIYQTTCAAWSLFRSYHYLSNKINPTSQCFVAIYQNKPVAFYAVLHFPHPTSKRIKRGHRMVVLPDYQGLGIGNAMQDAIAAHYKALGFRFCITFSHPSLIRYCSRPPNWRTSKHKHVPVLSKRSGLPEIKSSISSSRLTVSAEYVGPSRRLDCHA